MSIDLVNYIWGLSSAGSAGKDAWNAWRKENPAIIVDFSRHNFCGIDFTDFNLSHVNFSNATLSAAKLVRTNFSDADLAGVKLNSADLTNANLTRTKINRFDPGKGLFGKDKQSLRTKQPIPDMAAKIIARRHWESDKKGGISVIGGSRSDLSDANLSKATLIDTDISDANLSYANFTSAYLSGVNLNCATLVETIFDKATLIDCSVYGSSAWNLKLEGTTQHNLVVTHNDESTVKVDDIEVAQFIYLLLHNGKIRNVIDTITSKVVLILGRFTDERKMVLDAIHKELRRIGYTPVLFDFDKPASKDLTGTVELLARMARFIVADLTDPSSIPHELATIVPHLRTTPVLPLRQVGTYGYSMFDDYTRSYNGWVLPIREYQDCHSLILDLPSIIASANMLAEQFRNA